MGAAEAGIWTGRDDGPGAEHARWHTVVRPWTPSGSDPGAVVLIGFPSDEGVRRNQGRTGAAGGPDALRRALAPLAAPGLRVFDAGDVPVGTDLEDGQTRLGATVATVLASGALPVVLGGGHDVAYGSYLGWTTAPAPAERWGILNLDAHFDLREDRRSTSGTPFLQAARAEQEAGRALRYAVAGISRASNTRALFEAADALRVDWLSDEADDRGTLIGFVTHWLERVDRVHLSIDLDVLPGSVAPGVSAPAGFGLGVTAVRAAIREVVRSGKLGLLEVAELNPRFDIGGRTARVAARLVDEAVRALRSTDR